jgi:hypothetical protein
MKTKLIHGDTTFNNALALPEGMLSVDLEKKALRFHLDGIHGGFECLGERAYVPITGPGPTELIAGDEQAGFYGEIGPEEFISYSDLSSVLGVSAGTLINNAESAWLKVASYNKILYIAKKPIRGGISWNSINVAGAVHGTQLIIGEATFSSRLLYASNTNPESGAGGELTNVFVKLLNGELASYSAESIGGGGTVSSPRWPWAVETVAASTSNRVRYGGASGIAFNAATANDASTTATNSYNSWRPVLELIT